MSRVVPLTGTDQYRLLFAAANLLKDNEIHTTKDQLRLFLENNFIGPSIWQGDVADEATMIALNATASRGNFAGDFCKRLDTESIWLCISNRGESADDWVEFGSGSGGGSGDGGWSPVLAIVSDDERRVLQVTEWVGGTGTPPDSPVYIAEDGFTDTLADAVDIRGEAGADGADGEGGGGAGSTVTSEIREVLAETILGSDGDINWSGLVATGYDYFDIVLNVRGDYVSAALEGLVIRFNNDTTDANYNTVYSQYNGTSRFEGAFAGSGPSHMVASGETAGYFTNVNLRVIDPASTTRYKNVQGTGTSKTWIDARSVTWINTAAINQITLLGTNSTHFKAGSFARLIGVKKVDISVDGLGGSFSLPDTLPYAWYDASHPASVEHSAGVPATDTQGVSSWLDRSGNGYDLAQATGGNQPVFKTSIVNGKSVLRFDGTDDYLVNTGVPSFDLRKCTQIIVAAGGATAADFHGVLVIGPTGSGNDYDDTKRMAAEVTTGSNNFNFSGNNLSGSFVGPRPMPWAVRAMRLGEFGSVSDVSLNGGIRHAGPAATSFTTSYAGLLVGARYLSGAINTSYAFDGDIAEIIIWNRTLSNFELDNILNILNLKYGF